MVICQRLIDECDEAEDAHEGCVVAAHGLLVALVGRASHGHDGVARYANRGIAAREAKR